VYPPARQPSIGPAKPLPPTKATWRGFNSRRKLASRLARKISAAPEFIVS
jgi:hypothetical protein